MQLQAILVPAWPRPTRLDWRRAASQPFASQRRATIRPPANARQPIDEPAHRAGFFWPAAGAAQPWIFSPRASIATNFSTRARFVSGFTAVCTRQQNA